jgi:hypothetical protein
VRHNNQRFSRRKTPERKPIHQHDPNPRYFRSQVDMVVEQLILKAVIDSAEVFQNAANPSAMKIIREAKARFYENECKMKNAEEAGEVFG